MTKTVYILLYKASNNNYNATWVDKIIAWYTKGIYSHAELAIEKSGDIYTSWSSSPRDGKVRKTTIQVNPIHWDVIPVTISVNSINTIESFFLSINGDKYDWMGILGFILPIQDRTNRWFCSESVSNALKIIGWKPMWKLDPASISPVKLGKLLGKTDQPRVKFIDVIKALFKRK